MVARGWGYPRSAGVRHAFIPSWIFVLLVVLFVGGGVLAWQNIGSIGFDVFLFVVAGWMVSLSLHEYAHALIAYRSGDHSIVEKGYLKLNPLKYAHPFLSLVIPVIILLLGGIGLPGGAVWIDRHAIRTKWGASLISLAGPGVNLVLAIVLTVPFLVGVDLFAHFGFWAGVAFLAFLQLTAALLNILPLPGLDGGNALRPWLSEPYDGWFDKFAPYGMLLLFALLFEPRINQIFFAVVQLFADAFGLPFDLALTGSGVFQFWR